MIQYETEPVGTLVTKAKDSVLPGTHEPIYGGYTNARGEIALFGESLAFRVNLKNKTVRQGPGLNSEAQARYDAAESGEAFEYCSKRFSRLSDPEILEICASGPFRVMPRFV
ncbi:MAG TPA: hypothetical protein VMB20_14365 [Candidatus Acidoferrum sp.]|nr:hypothetical protein [Candidatus Acidoferrum sp.]